jgi:uroporphyrinogen-III decarboxylase
MLSSSVRCLGLEEMVRPIDAREAVRSILQGAPPPRPLFLPIVFSRAARIENLPLPTFLANPTKITQALRQIRTHLRSDGLTCYFDPYLEIEALGGILEWGSSEQPSVHWARDPLNCELPVGARTMDELPAKGRIPMAVEVIRRMKSLVRDEALLTVGISGPFALAAQVMRAQGHASGETEISAGPLELASEAIAPIAKAFLEAGANVVFIREEMPPSAPSLADWSSLLATTINIVRFYEAIPVLLLSVGAQNLDLALRQSLDCVVCPVLSETLLRAADEWIEPAPANLGFAIPASVTAEDQASLEKSAADLRRVVQILQPSLITTSGDVPPSADLRILNKLRDFLIA